MSIINWKFSLCIIIIIKSTSYQCKGQQKIRNNGWNYVKRRLIYFKSTCFII